MKSANMKGLSKDAKDLLKKLLQPIHKKRNFAVQALDHKWFKNAIRHRDIIDSKV